MPDYFGGTIVAIANPTQSSSPFFSGTVTGEATGATPDPDAMFTGSVSVDRRDWQAFVPAPSFDRMAGASVILDGLVETTLVGTVSVEGELSAVLTTATFEAARPEVCAFDPATLAGRAIPSSITFRVGPPGGLRDVVMWSGDAFVDDTTGAWIPRGRFRGAGPGSAVSGTSILQLLSTPVCVSVPGLSNRTRGDILVDAIESVGVTVSNAATVRLQGGTVKKPVDLGAISPLELIARWGEAEGWRVRVVAGTVGPELEILQEDDLEAAPPVLVLTPDLMLGPPREIPPKTPVTAWTIATTVLTPETAAQAGTQTQPAPQVTGGVNAAGLAFRTTIKRVLWDGVEVRRTESYEETVQAPGTALGPLTLQEVQRLELELDYVPIYDAALIGHPSTRPSRKKTRTYRLDGIPAAADYSGVATWTDGSQRTSGTATVMLWEEQTETFSWSSTLVGDPDDCTLKGSHLERYGYYSPLVDPAGTHHTYWDNAARADDHYQWGLIWQEDVNWTDQRIQQPGAPAHPPQVSRTALVYKYIPTGATSDGVFIESTVPQAAERVVESWVGNQENTKHVHRTQTSKPVGIASVGNWQEQSSLSLGDVSENVEGPVPGPPIAAADLHQFDQQLVKVTVDFLDFQWARKAQAEVVEFLESQKECETLATRRARRSNGKTYEVPTVLLPHIREGDVLAIDYPDLQLDPAAAKGWIERIRRDLELTNGWGTQTLEIYVPPLTPVVVL